MALFIKTNPVFARNCFAPPTNTVIINVADTDGDGVENLADNCPNAANADQTDSNHDGIGEACDKDTDGFPDQCDNCLSLANPDQADTNANDVGDACETKLTKMKKQKLRQVKSESVAEDFDEFKDNEDQFELDSNEIEDKAPVDLKSRSQ